MPRVFVSYSRVNRDFAKKLRQDLIDAGFDVYRDLHDLEPGKGWWPQLKEAIENSETMVLCLSVEALASPNVADEWRYARQIGTRVIPVVADEVFKHEKMESGEVKIAHWMNKADWLDFREGQPEATLAKERLLNTLNTPYTPRRVPFTVPPSLHDAEQFVERPREYDALKALLLSEDRQTPVAITTALQGGGGFGKTALAAALCYDDDITTAFDDGIFWVTVSETPDIEARLQDVHVALTGDRSKSTDAHQIAADIKTAMDDRDCLIVLDDIWKAVHARPFLHLGEHCAYLITTRQEGVAFSAGAERINVDEMQSSEAVKLLLRGINPPDDLEPFEVLAARLGEWPLLLEIVNGMLRKRLDRRSLDNALRWVTRMLDKQGVLSIVRDDEDSRRQGAAGTLALSIGQLDTADQAAYLELAIFPEDTTIPLTTLAALWGLDEDEPDDLFETEARVEALASASLLRWDGSVNTIRLHDVVREYLLMQVDDIPGLHARLLENWGDPRSLPDEYAWRHVAYHLFSIGHTNDLRALLLDYDFIRSKLAVTDPAALAADCTLLPDDRVMRIMRSFWTTSAHVLSEPENHDQLYNQLIGRLGLHEEAQPDIRTLLEYVRGAAKYHPDPMLNLQKPSLNAAGGMLKRILKGHTSGVGGALVLPDGDGSSCRLLSWSEDNTLRLWNGDGQVLAVLEGHTDEVWGALVLPGGGLLSWSRDHTLRLWDSEGQALAVLEGHTNIVRGALVLPGGGLLSWSLDHTLRLWDGEGQALAVLEGHTSGVGGALVLPDGDGSSCRLLSWSEDNTLRLWNGDGQVLAVLEGHTDEVRGALVLLDGGLLSWSRDHTLRLWDSEGQALAALEGHTDIVRGALALPGGRLLSWSYDHTLRLWDSEGQALAVLKGHMDVSGALVLLDGGSNYRLLSWASSSNDKNHTLRLWDGAGQTLAVLEGHMNVNGALVLPDGRLLSWSNDGTLRLWDRDGQALGGLEGHTSWVIGALVLPDGRLLSWSRDHSLRLWDGEGQALAVLKGHPATVWGALSLPDGHLLSWAFSIVSRDHTLRLWDSEGQALAVLEGHMAMVWGTLVLPNSGGSSCRLLSWSIDHTLRLWDSEGQALAVLEGHTDIVSGVLVLPDGHLLSWSGDHTLRLWDSEGQALAVLKDHTAGVSGALVLLDGNGSYRLLSWSGDHTLRLWDGEGQALAVLEGHTSGVRGALVLSDGRLLSWSGDHTLRLWDGEGQALAVLEGHTSGVRGALVLSDGRLLSWSGDHTLRLWDGEGQALAVLEGHTSGVPGALVLPDGGLLSWSGDDFRLWSADGVALGVINRDEGERLRWDARRAAGEAVPPVEWQTDGDVLVGRSTQTGAVVCRFVSDAELMGATQFAGTTVAVSGAGGTMHFLKPNAVLRRIMAGEEA
jgi:WD40 repeat protein